MRACNQNASLHLAAFHLDGPVNGGVKRSRQLALRAGEAGLRVVSMPRIDRALVWATILHPVQLSASAAAAIWCLGQYVNMKGLFVGAVYGVWLRRIWCDVEVGPVDIELAHDPSLIIATLLQHAGVVCRVYPQNIESQVPGRSLSCFRSRAALAEVEFGVHQRATQAVAISDCDAQWLSKAGIANVSLQAYEPVGADRDLLERIAQRRANPQNPKRGVLLLGSAANGATRQGLLRLFEVLQTYPEPLDMTFTLIGNGTELLAEDAPDAVIVRGRVTESELEDALAGCAAVLVYQEPTTGMMTRLIDAVIAQVPTYVMGGYVQAETMHSPFVQCISCLSEIVYGLGRCQIASAEPEQKS